MAKFCPKKGNSERNPNFQPKNSFRGSFKNVETQGERKYESSKFSSEDEDERELVSEDEYHSMHGGFDERQDSYGDGPENREEQTFNGSSSTSSNLLLKE